MKHTKQTISKNISNELKISLGTSKLICSSFIDILKKQGKLNNIKIHEFGTFFIHKTPKRLGRNPKTKESYIILQRRKLCFKASNKIKKILN